MFHVDHSPKMYAMMLGPRRSAYHPYSYIPRRMRSYKPAQKSYCCRQPEASRFISQLLNLSDSDSEDEHTNVYQMPSAEEMFQSFILGFDNEHKRKTNKRRASGASKVQKKASGNESEKKTGVRKCAEKNDQVEEKQSLPSLDDLFHRFLEYSAKKESDRVGHLDTENGQKNSEPTTEVTKDSDLPGEKSIKGDTKFIENKEEANQEHEARKSDDEITVVELDMRGADPDSINVRISREKMTATITAHFAVFTPFGPFMRQLTKVVPIPEGIVPQHTRSFITSDGMFYLKGARKVVGPKQNREEIRKEELPIDAVGDVSKGPVLNGSVEGDGSSDTKIGTQSERVSNSEIDMVEKPKCPSQEEYEPMETTQTEPTHEPRTKEIAKETQDIVQTNPATCEDDSARQDESVAKATESSKDGTETAESDIIMQFNMSGFATDDIKLNIDTEKRLVEVAARREDETDSGHVVREYYRAFNVPPEVDMAEIKTDLGADDVFSISATKRMAAITE